MLLEKQWYLLTSLDVCSDFSASPIVCQLVWGAESLQGRLSINPRRPLWGRKQQPDKHEKQDSMALMHLGSGARGIWVNWDPVALLPPCVAFRTLCTSLRLRFLIPEGYECPLCLFGFCFCFCVCGWIQQSSLLTECWHLWARENILPSLPLLSSFSSQSIILKSVIWRCTTSSPAVCDVPHRAWPLIRVHWNSDV